MLCPPEERYKKTVRHRIQNRRPKRSAEGDEAYVWNNPSEMEYGLC
jgi:hypothetical protein